MAAVLKLLTERGHHGRGAVNVEQEAIAFAVTELHEVGAIDRLERPMRFGSCRRYRHRPRLAVVVSEIGALPLVLDPDERCAAHGLIGPLRAIPFRSCSGDIDRA